MSTRLLNKPEAQIRIYRDPQELALKAARRFARLADQYVIGCGRFTVALSSRIDVRGGAVYPKTCAGR